MSKRINHVIQDLKQKRRSSWSNLLGSPKKNFGWKKGLLSSLWTSKWKITDGKAEILERYADYYEDLLSYQTTLTGEEKTVKSEVEKEFKELLLEANTQEPPKISKEDISKAIKGLKRKKAADRQGWKSEWVLEGGPEMITSLQILFSRIQEERKMPDQWNKMTIRTIHKKGSKKDLKNQRGIFLASILYKCFKRVIIARNQTRISNRITEFQCGGCKGMSTINNVMAISGLIERYRTL